MPVKTWKFFILIFVNLVWFRFAMENDIIFTCLSNDWQDLEKKYEARTGFPSPERIETRQSKKVAVGFGKWWWWYRDTHIDQVFHIKWSELYSLWACLIVKDNWTEVSCWICYFCKPVTWSSAGTHETWHVLGEDNTYKVIVVNRLSSLIHQLILYGNA